MTQPEETHVEVDKYGIKENLSFILPLEGKTKLTLNYHIGYRDYRDITTFLERIPEKIRNSDKITFVSDAYVN